MPKSISRLETPALILDAGRLERNLARMREKLARHAVALRPHVKTAKSVEVVRHVRAARGLPRRERRRRDRGGMAAIWRLVA